MSQLIRNECSSSRNEGSSSSGASGESLNSNIELNVKTLDSHTYHYVVDRNMPVLAFKEKIANDVRLSAGQQKLLFGGRALKDGHRLSEYHVECGDTLYLVERQQTQYQRPADSGWGEPRSSGSNQVSAASNVGALDISQLPVTVPQSGSQPSTGSYFPMEDSVYTLIDFMNVIEMRGYRPNTLQTWSAAQEPENTQGLPTIVALGVALRQANQLLSSHTVTALSHLRGQFEHYFASTDLFVRTQVRGEVAGLGMAMQHLGALSLELGRTLQTLQLSQTPGGSIVHYNPPIFISPSGPNPIMVQPFPLQTNTLLGNSLPLPHQVTFVAPWHGDIHRHVVIDISGGDEEGGNANDSTETHAVNRDTTRHEHHE